jgi:hypothetical protein
MVYFLLVGSLPAFAWGDVPLGLRSRYDLQVQPLSSSRVVVTTGRSTGLPRSVQVPAWVRFRYLHNFVSHLNGPRFSRPRVDR